MLGLVEEGRGPSGQVATFRRVVSLVGSLVCFWLREGGSHFLPGPRSKLKSIIVCSFLGGG